MKKHDVIESLRLLAKERLDVWVDGGWGVDALVGKQTRPHSDLDIVIRQSDVSKLRDLLEQKGYRDVPRDDTSPWNFVLGDSSGREVDVHAIIFDAEGNGLYGSPERGTMYPAASLTGTGTIGDHKVKCISAEWAIQFKTRYAPIQKSRADVQILSERFHLSLSSSHQTVPRETGNP